VNKKRVSWFPAFAGKTIEFLCSFFWPQVFDKVEHFRETEMEILIDQDLVLFSWNDEAIQEMAEALGEPEFPEPRPCG